MRQVRCGPSCARADEHESNQDMSEATSLDTLSLQKFAIGQPVPRAEDQRLVRGQGQYTDDVNLPGQAYAVVVKSTVAHGIIEAIDTAAARAMPGVLAIYTGAGLAKSAYGGFTSRMPLKSRDGSALRAPERPALTSDKVRFVGDPIAFVVAETLDQASAAAEAVVVEIAPLDAVVDPRQAGDAGMPNIWTEAPDNLALDYLYGEPAKVEAAFAAAAHVTHMRLHNKRLVVAAMEPRACVASFDKGSGRFTLYASTQGVLGSKAAAAGLMKVAPDKMRFVAVNVGGSFGMKAAIFPEYVCAMHAARDLGRGVKWTDSRSESFTSDHQGRAQDFDASLALDKDGRILALRLAGFADLGAYLTNFGPLMPTTNVMKHVTSLYKTPLIEVGTRCVFTNTVPVTAYRGAGRPEGNYYMERLIETAAREMGIDSAEIRRRNHIQPSDMPYKAASGSVYDCGDFPAILERALAAADWTGFPARAKQSAARGKLRGRGIGQFVETTAPVMKELGSIRFNADGTVVLRSGTHDQGQGHSTTFAQVVSDRLGIPFHLIRLMQTDSDELPAGGGTGGSKSLMASGTALVEAGIRVIDKAKEAAAHILEASPADIRFEKGRLSIVGTDRGIALLDLARQVKTHAALPAGFERSLDVDYVHDAAPATYPNGCHIAEVEIDPDTGIVEVARYTTVGDFGTLVNPLIVEGQLRGGVVQGLGQCLMEATRYDEDGQILSGSFMDYALPRAADAPSMSFLSLPVPTKNNPLGVKGCGEAGVAGSVTSIMNAIVDALFHLGIKHIEMPATPEVVWRAIREANGTGKA
jgi:aerobic carbon-monoxide dehydrogenase large subunit